MPYLVKGNAQDLFNAFDLSWVIESRIDPSANHINLDLPRSKFLGTEQQARHHIKTWKTKGKADYYMQGNMSAANLYLLFGPDHIFYKAKHEEENWKQNYIYFHCAFVNDKQELCALSFVCQREDPGFWFMGLIKNTNLVPEQRTVALLSGFELEPYIKNPNANLELRVVAPSTASLHTQMSCKLVESLIATTIKADTGEMDLRCARLSLLLRYLDVDNPLKPIKDEVSFKELDSKNFFAENSALDLAARYHLDLSATLLMDALSKKGGLRLALAKIKLSADFKRNQNYLRMFLIVYEANVLELCKALLVDFKLLTIISNLLQNPQQRSLIIFILNQKYSNDLLKLVLTDEAYFSPIPALAKYGVLEKDFMDLYFQPGKLAELQFIHTVNNEEIKKLCLVFWTKGRLSIGEYKALVKAAKENPGLVKTLLDLDKPGTISIDDLKKCAFDVLKRQVKTIVHQFAANFEQAGINKQNVKVVSQFNSVADLNALSRSLTVLKSVTLSDPHRAYSAVLKNDNEGKLVRLFVPQFLDITDIETRRSLLELFFIGITKGPVSQATAMHAFKDKPDVYALAKDLHERYICSQQIQDLHFNDMVVSFTAEKNDEAASFRHIVLRVEEECKRVHRRVGESWDPNRLRIIQEWQNAHEEYRKTLYGLAFDQLKANKKLDPNKLKAKITAAERKVLAIVDAKIHSWLYLSLVVIANIVITALTLGIANSIKHQKSGNFWFFNRAKSGEKLSALDQEVYNLLL
ncbi:MAG: hypothetical protein WC627_01680 [Legionella sp.]|jgi:hypothetical protein